MLSLITLFWKSALPVLVPSVPGSSFTSVLQFFLNRDFTWTNDNFVRH